MLSIGRAETRVDKSDEIVKIASVLLLCMLVASYNAGLVAECLRNEISPWIGTLILVQPGLEKNGCMSRDARELLRKC